MNASLRGLPSSLFVLFHSHCNNSQSLPRCHHLLATVLSPPHVQAIVSDPASQGGNERVHVREHYIREVGYGGLPATRPHRARGRFIGTREANLGDRPPRRQRVGRW